MDIRLDVERSEIVCGLRRQKINGIKLKILSWFLSHPAGWVMQRSYAMEEYWSVDADPKSLDSAISDIRAVLKKIGSKTRFEVAWGQGYRMAPAHEDIATAQAWRRILAAAEPTLPAEVALVKTALEID